MQRYSIQVSRLRNYKRDRQTYQPTTTVQQPKRVDFFSFFLQIVYGLLHIVKGDMIYLSAGTESSTIGASIGPPPVTSYDIINIKWLSEDVYLQKSVRNRSSLFL